MMHFSTIEEALEDLRQGKIILATDDPDRENEGDFICAAEFATTENINFMATHGKGLICMPMSERFVKKLKFPQMVQHNTDNHELQRVFPPPSVRLRRWPAWTTTQRPGISAGRATCSPFWQRKTACWSETATQRPQSIYAAWRV